MDRCSENLGKLYAIDIVQHIRYADVRMHLVSLKMCLALLESGNLGCQ